MRVISVLLIFGMVVAFVFFIVSAYSDYWTENGNVHAGLWRICTPSCGSITPSEPTEDRLRSIRAFIIIAVLMQSCMIFLASARLSAFVKINLYFPMIAAGVLAVVSALIALVIYTDTYEDHNVMGAFSVSYGWSYGIGWAGFGVGLVVVIATAIIERRHNQMTLA